MLLRAALDKAGANGLSLDEQDQVITDRNGPGRATRARKVVADVLQAEGFALASARREDGTYIHVIRKAAKEEA